MLGLGCWYQPRGGSPSATGRLAALVLPPGDDTRFHLQGAFADPDLAFGASTHNGVGCAWTSGPTPGTDLTDNAALASNFTWNGALLGFTPTDQTVSAAAAILVDLATLTGRADFTRLESWGARATPGATGARTRWLDGDLGHAIAGTGNSFRRTGGNAGTLSGAFWCRARRRRWRPRTNWPDRGLRRHTLTAAPQAAAPGRARRRLSANGLRMHTPARLYPSPARQEEPGRRVETMSSADGGERDTTCAVRVHRRRGRRHVPAPC